MKKFFVFIFVLLNFCAITVAQNVTTLRFTGQGQNGSYVQLSSVEVTNLTRGWDETLVYPDTILMLGAVGIDDYSAITQFALSQNTPNPFKGSTDFTLQLPEHAKVVITVFDISGKKVTDITKELPAGIHIFRVILNTPQAYLVTARTDLHSASIKIVNQGKASHNRIEYRGMGSGHIRYEIGGPKSVATGHDFHQGDLMCYVGKYLFNDVEYVSDTILQPQYGSEDFTLVFPCVPVSSYTFSATTCDTFSLNGITYTESGTYTQTFPMDNGCDSIVTLNLLVNQPSAQTVDLTVCGEYVWNGEPYSQSGSYTQTFTAANECDSIVTLNLTVNQPVQHSFAATTCDTYVWNGEPYSQSGTYTQTFQAANECDSIVTLNLTVNPPVTHSFSDASCLYYVWNGQTYTQSGSYTQIFQAANGCDSVVTLNLTVNQPVTHSFSDASCLFYIWNGLTYTQSGTFTQILQAANGCDSIVTLDLTITQPVTHSFSATACGSYTWNGVTYTQSGSYTQTFTAANGCDSTVTLDLTVNALTVPMVSEVQVYEVGMHSAYLVSSVQSDDCTNIQAQGFCWDTLPNPDLTGNHIEVAVRSTEFSGALMELDRDQTYYVRAYATNEIGTAYGAETSFTTDAYLSYGLMVDTPCTSYTTANPHSAEVLEYCVGTDSVRLSIGNYEFGIIQWQFSRDTVEWTNIENANDTFYLFYPEESGYYRARMTYNLCPMEYSQMAYLHLAPRADAGYDRMLNAGYRTHLFGNEFEDATGHWTVLAGENAEIDDPTDPTSLFMGHDSLYVLTWTLTNSCGTSTDTVTLRFIHTVFADHIVVVDTTDLILSDSAEMASGLYRIVFNDPVPTIVDSTILVGIPNGGFLRKVIVFENQGDTVVMYTQQATLDDLIEEGVVSFNSGEMSNSSQRGGSGYARLDHLPTRAELAENADFSDGRIWYYECPTEYGLNDRSRGGSATFQLPINVFDFLEIIPLSLQVSELSFQPDFVTDFNFSKQGGHIHAYYLNELRVPLSFKLKIKMELSESASADSTLADSTIDKNIATLTKAIVLVVFGVPVEVTAKFQIVLGAELKATISAEKNYRVSGEIRVGQTLRYDNGEANVDVSKMFRDFSCVDLDANGDSIATGLLATAQGINVNGSIKASVSLKAKLSLEFYNFVGPYGEIGPRISLKHCYGLNGIGTGNVTMDGSREYKVDIPWKVGLSMKIFKKKVFDVNYDGVLFKLWESKSPDHLESLHLPSYDLGDNMYHPGSFKVCGSLPSPSIRVHMHSSSGFISDSIQGLSANNTTVERLVRPNDTVNIYWKPDLTMSSSFIQASVVDCEGQHIDNSPMSFIAFAGDHPCRSSNLQLSAVDGQLRATGGRPPYEYSDDGIQYSYVPMIPQPEQVYYVRDMNNCVVQYVHPSFECSLQINYQLSGNTVIALATNGSAPYHFYLDDSSSPFVTSMLPTVAIPVSDGDHKLSVTDQNGCTSVVRFNVDNGQYPPTVFLNQSYNTLNNTYTEVQGIVVDDGNLTITERGIYYGQTSNMASATKVIAPLDTATGAYVCAIPEDIAAMPYYVCAYAVNAEGTAYSDTVLIYRNGYAPMVRTDSVFNITGTTARVAGTVLLNGVDNAEVVERGICWNTTGNPTVADSHTLDDWEGVGSFVNTLTGLTPGTTYYVRAYAYNLEAWAYGEELTFTTTDVLTDSTYMDGQPCPGIPTVTDIEGNVYNTVLIGHQCWMRENLKTTRYADNTPILHENNFSDTVALWFYPNNDSSTVPTFGLLYNRTAVMHGAAPSQANPSGVQGICPSGWHVPSNAEWNQLTDYVGSQSENVCGDNNTYIAKALAANMSWDNAVGGCNVGNNISENNSTGFSALPAGYIYNSWGDHVYKGTGYYAAFWNSTAVRLSEYTSEELQEITAGNATVDGRRNIEATSVRCLFDVGLPIVTTNTTVTNITYTSATPGGNVISEGNAPVTARGVCWSINHNPTVNDRHTVDGSGLGSFISNITGLTANIYHVRAYATNLFGTSYGNEVVFSANDDGQPCPNTPTVMDVDGNVYNTVRIGSQCWMKENLKTTKYADNIGIELNGEYSSTIPYRYYPNGDSNNVSVHGLLYNWPAAMHGAASSEANPSGVQGICPNGWHVPSDAEWTKLVDYVRSQNQYLYNGDRNYIAKAFTVYTSGWWNTLNDCAPGNGDTCNSNATGFSALPSTFYNNGGFYSGGGTGFWSTTTSSDDCRGWTGGCFGLSSMDCDAGVGRLYKEEGLSIRCVRDEGIEVLPTFPVVLTIAPSSSYIELLTCGGNILYDGGRDVISRGICWSTSPNPTIEDEHTVDGSGTGSYISTFANLNPLTTYYVRAYATNSIGTSYGEEIIVNTASGHPCTGTPTITDIDGNVYNTVEIGKQCWMKENLRTRYAPDGRTRVGYQIPNDDINNKNTYGYLYNWTSVMHGQTSSNTNQGDVQGICPDGWHIPRDTEWTQLTDYIRNQNDYLCDGNTLSIAKSLANSTNWHIDTLESACTVGNNQAQNNTTGFSALPAGFYVDYVWDIGAAFGIHIYESVEFNETAYFLSSTSIDSNNVYGRKLSYESTDMESCTLKKDTECYSVRCIKDITLPTVFTSEISNVDFDNHTAVCGGNVTLDGGADVTAGVCWSTDPNPTIHNYHTIDGSGVGPFISLLSDLIPYTTYYIRSYATNSVGTVYGEQVSLWSCDGQACPNTPTVIDIDENIYNTVRIGSQCWMKENLRTTRYADSSPIPLATDFCTSVLPYRYKPNNDDNNISTYGYLYNCAAVMREEISSDTIPNRIQGICPTGWHVPSSAEWTQMTDYVSSFPKYWCGGEKSYIGRSLASPTGWEINACPGCAVYEDNMIHNNMTGFSAVPAGEIVEVGTQVGGSELKYSSFGHAALYATSTTDSMETLDRMVVYIVSDADVSSSSIYKKYASSVRCVCDDPDGQGGSLGVSVTTSENVTHITSTSATCGGNVTIDGEANVIAKGVCWSSDHNPTINDTHTIDGTGAGEFTSALAGLTTGTTYLVRAYATSSSGIVYGDVVSFTTLDVPSVITADISDVTATTAVCGGEVTDDGGAEVLDRGVCWSTAEYPTINDSHTTDGNGIGSFNSSMSDLTPNTVYHVRAYATNQYGTAYGNVVRFTTPVNINIDEFSCPGTPTVTDIDGNVYNTVQIGEQCWMRENLRTTRYADSTPILFSRMNWNINFIRYPYSNTEPYHYAPNDSESNVPAYGYLYNWSAVMHGAASATPFVQGICPDGWHVPSDAEWSQLTDYVSTQSQYVCDSANSYYIAKSLASTIGWNAADGECMIGNNQSTNNATGFSVLPAGRSYSLFAASAYLWSKDPITAEYAWTRTFSFDSEFPIHQPWSRGAGLSVRCVYGGGSLGLSVITSENISRITSTTATCSGDVISDGGANVTAKGVCWNRDYIPTIDDSHTADGAGAGSFTSTLTGLTTGETYFVRAYATNSSGTVYGDVVRFTMVGVPSVITDDVTDITATTAVCGGEVTDDGGAEVINRGVCWSTSPNPTIDDSHTSDGGGMGEFSSTIRNLDYGTLYYVRAYATNSLGTAYGEAVCFTTTVNTNSDEFSCPGTTTLTDIDGNVYRTVRIGNQCWMRENLRTTKYADGTPIVDGGVAYGSAPGFWDTTACWFYPFFNECYKPIYGLHYNRLSLIRSSESSKTTPGDELPSHFRHLFLETPVQGICPDGWHVPSDAEWNQLKDYVSSQSRYVCGNDNSNIAKSLASTWDWNDDGTECTVGNNLSANNTTGFSAVPSGSRYYPNDGSGAIAKFWSSSYKYMGGNGIIHILQYNSPSVGRTDVRYHNRYGFSVRCVRDYSILRVHSAAVSNISFNSAVCGGEVIDDDENDGVEAIERGVCWSITHQPTIADSHTTDGSGTGTFISTLTGLANNCTYFVRAYVTSEYGTVYGEEVSITTPINPNGDNLSCPGMPTLTDIDGNTYNTVQIGEQCWMRENLRTTRYADGTNLAQGSDTTSSSGYGWYPNNDPTVTANYWFYPNNDTSLKQSFGLLYNWPALMQDAGSTTACPSGVKGICPDGWHIPSKEEWTQLTNYVTNHFPSSYIPALASKEGWWNSGTGLGSDMYTYNATGFSARPTGDYYFTDGWPYYGQHVFYACATSYNEDYLYLLSFGHDNLSSFYWYNYSPNIRQSVRCLRDMPVPTIVTSDVTDITAGTAVCGGEVTDDGGAEVINRGVCWSTSEYPTINDSHTTDGNGTGSFVSSMSGLSPNTIYNVRAYATNQYGTAYGEVVKFRTICDTVPIVISGDFNPCFGETTTLTASGAISYRWNTGETTASIIVDPATAKRFLLQESFDNGLLPSGWITVDQDGDDYSWYGANINGLYTHSGDGCVVSASYDQQPLTPDDWMITSTIAIPANAQTPTLSWWAIGQDPNWAEEHYAVYISTTGQATTDFNTNEAVYEGESTSEYVQHTVDLSAYAGQTIHVAFRHYNVTNMFLLNIDDIEVYYTNNTEPVSYIVSGTDAYGCSSTQSVIVSVNIPPLPEVTTLAVSDLTTYSATCGGEVADGGAPVIARGVCWSTTHNPTIDDHHTSDGSGAGVFTSSITGLNANTTYYVRAYATNGCTAAYGEEVSFTTLLPPPPIVDEKSCPGTPTVTDYDSNVYNTVKIGTQCWMRENLRTTKYSDGTAIPMGNSNYSYTDPYYYDYYNSGFPLNERGYLYNLSAVMKDTPSSNEIPSGVQGICPIGWHVPSAAEWTQMTTYMSSHPEYTYLGIAKALASTTGWETTDYGCAVGNDQSVNNASGFCAVPAGRYDYGSFFDAGQEAEFWLSSEEEDYSMQHIASVGCYMYIGMIYSCIGASVRCLRDSAYTAFAPTVTTSSVNEVTSSTAICGGNVMNDGDAIILSCGICWSTSPEPTINDNHTNDGSGLGEFNSTILGMTSGTTYYVRAYATNSAGTGYGEEISFTTPAFNSDTAFICGLSTVTDHEGHEYHTVSIGSQCWTKENLRTTTSPSTGTYLIPTDNSGLTVTGKQAFWYNNDSATYAPMNYGLLYNWNAAVDTFNTAYGETSVDTSSDHSFSVTFSGIRRGICPEGWHIPTDAEWTVLNNYMSSQRQFTCGGDSNNIAKALASATGWETEWWNNDCCPMSSPSTNNASGFSALPAGIYLYDIVCESDADFNILYCDTILSNDGLGEFSLFWCASQNNGENAWCRFISVSEPYLEKDTMRKNTAGSVRCVYNADIYNSATVPTVTTSAVTIISDNVAVGGGEVLSDGGTPVTARGVCWSTSQNPTVSDYHTTDGDGTGSYTSNMTELTGVSTFYVRAYATNCVGTAYGEEVRFTTVPYPVVQPCPESPTVTDYDGNVYNTLQIGNQCWMRENLRTTHFPEGTAITEGMLLPAPMGPGHGEPTIADPAYYRVNINGVYDTLYGFLYNWSAVMHGLTSSIEDSIAVQGICPDGWHVPSDTEWNMLMDYVSSQSIYWCGNDSLNVAKPLAATTGWVGSYSSCSIGNNQNANNATGFSAFPSGSAAKTASYPNSYHIGLGTDACFWSSSSSSAYRAVGRCLLNNAANISARTYDKNEGLSVRCLRGEGQTHQEGGVGSGTGEGGDDTGSGGGGRP